MRNYPSTPDGRYFVAKGRLWRRTNPHLDMDTRQRWVNELMDARRTIGVAKLAGDDAAVRAARDRVQAAKVALGERGPTWWDDETDFNQYAPANTPYARWWLDIRDRVDTSATGSPPARSHDRTNPKSSR